MSILSDRLHRQLISHHPHDRVEQVVQHMLCIQSQDITQSRRAIASRMPQPDCIDQITQAYQQGLIVRTWTQRGTIHAICSSDVKWMLDLCASQTLSGFARRRQSLSMSDQVCQEMTDCIIGLLRKNPQSRANIADHLQTSGFILGSNRIYHILCYMGTQGLIVQGPIQGKEHLFVLTSTRLPTQILFDTKVEAVTHLCQRYLVGHGPARIIDIMWWSGLGKTIIKQGLEACGARIQYDEQTQCYNLTDTTSSPVSKKSSAVRLAGFDERLLGYKDRTDTLALEYHTAVDVSRNGIFKPTVMVDGQTCAIWTAKTKTKVVVITIKPFHPLSQSYKMLITQASVGYRTHIQKDIEIVRDDEGYGHNLNQ